MTPQETTADRIDEAYELGFYHGSNRRDDITGAHVSSELNRAYAEGYSRGLEFYGEANQCYFAPLG